MFDNTREYNEILQFITLFLLVVIGVMIYSMNDNSERIEQEITVRNLTFIHNIIRDTTRNKSNEEK